MVAQVTRGVARTQSHRYRDKSEEKTQTRIMDIHRRLRAWTTNSKALLSKTGKIIYAGGFQQSIAFNSH